MSIFGRSWDLDSSDIFVFALPIIGAKLFLDTDIISATPNSNSLSFGWILNHSCGLNPNFKLWLSGREFSFCGQFFVCCCMLAGSINKISIDIEYSNIFSYSFIITKVI